MEAVFVVVGGGIAGVSCAETLAFLQPEKSVVLLSESALIKTVSNLRAVTRTIVEFDVLEESGEALSTKHGNVKVIHDTLAEILCKSRVVVTGKGLQIKYEYLCLCMGAEPKLIPQALQFPQYIVGIRDTDSVGVFLEKLKGSRKVVVVGNGGIASEVVYKIEKTEIHWVVKDKHISATFVDPGAAEFFQDSLHKSVGSEQPSLSKRMRYSEDHTHSKPGAALGPDWYKNLLISGGNSAEKCVTIHYNTEVVNISSESGLIVTLSNGEKVSCDLIVSATGVSPRRNYTISEGGAFELTEDGGIKVDEFMKTNLDNIYAAGDLCSANWDVAKHWFQMKLWTQARQMGCYAAKSMSGHLNQEVVLQDFCFEIFTHSTKLFGYKVILLGLYNGQKLNNQYEILVRTTRAMEYIKFVIQNHKLQGAVLIGETDLEETCENLILNQTDLEPYGDDILNPDIDIEDYFD